MADTPESGKKSAERTSERTSEEVKGERGRKGAETVAPDPEKKSAASQKAAETIKRENPEHFKDIGAKGGKAGGHQGGQSGGSRQEEE